MIRPLLNWSISEQPYKSRVEMVRNSQMLITTNMFRTKHIDQACQMRRDGEERPCVSIRQMSAVQDVPTVSQSRSELLGK